MDGLLDVARPLLTAMFGAILIALLQRWELVRDWFLLLPLRQKAGSGEGRRRASALGQQLLTADPDATGAQILIDAMNREEGLADRSRVAELGVMLRSLARPGSHGPVSRLVWGEEEKNLHSQAKKVLSALHPFERANEIEASTVEAGSDFSTWATGVSGALILLDSLNYRGRIAHDVLVWHNATYRGHPAATGSSYEEAHESTCPAGLAVQEPGDYDARVLNLDGCAYLEDSTGGSLIFVLETSETCYAATEQGDEPWGCKHLSTRGIDLGIGFELSVPRRRVGDRLCMLASYVALMTLDRKLVLCRRSSAVRSGPGVLSATAGGVCEPGDWRKGDRDSLGWPDPIETCRRELGEELGVDVPRPSLRPAALFMANSVNPVKDEGQLVATLLSVARTDLTFHEVQEHLWSRSDLAAGRFEVDDLVPVEMGAGIDAFMECVESHMPDLDQHGALSIIYAGAVVWGREELRKAFDRAVANLGSNPLARRIYTDPKNLVVSG